MLRNLPPAAVPITPSDLRKALSPPAQAVARFQQALSEALGLRVCRLAASGRTALYLLLRGLVQVAGDQERREVLMPAYTCPALAKVALDLGLRPRWVDIAPHTLACEEAQLEAQLGERVLAVIWVHPFGMPQPMGRMRALAASTGAALIEDAAQAMGARQDGKPVGSQGNFGLFSLGPGKPLSTGGGGGVGTCDERGARLLERAWQELPAPSAAASAWALSRLALLALAFHPRSWWLVARTGLQRYGDREVSWGYALRGLSDVQAALGLTLLERLEAINRRRRQNAVRLMVRLQGLDFVHVPPPAAGTEPIYLRLPVLVADEDRRERLLRRLAAAGLGAGRMYGRPLPDLFPGISPGSYPGAAAVARRLLTLPTHPYLTEADVERIGRIFEAERNR
jgi:dTDP-4-amino-4,6-dideoxygalactose transaminase